MFSSFGRLAVWPFGRLLMFYVCLIGFARLLEDIVTHLEPGNNSHENTSINDTPNNQVLASVVTSDKGNLASNTPNKYL